MLPEAGGGGMQEPCKERECAGASPTLDIVKTEPPSWTPEDFLQSTLHEGKGIICPAGGSAESGKTTRGRRKQQWKLKFHHQALPPEYLDHYEASLNKTRPPMANSTPPAPQTDQTQNLRKTASASASVQTDIKPPALYDLNNLPNESIHNWLQRITNIQNEIQKSSGSAAVVAAPSAATAATRRRRTPPTSSASTAPPSASKVLNYRDLPYMGEMTLNNSKPRRGRKPKKADICHLIYKNYGTIFPGTPSHLVDERLSSTSTTFDKNFQIKQERIEKSDALVAPNKQRTDLQNKIISSLLEKRLSQESKKNRDKAKKSKHAPVAEDEQTPMLPPMSDAPSSSTDIEPLNLCVRDLNNLKIRLLRKHGNVYAKANIVPKTEPPERVENDEEANCDSSVIGDVNADNPSPECSSPILKMDVPDFKKALQETTSSSETISSAEKPEGEVDGALPGGYVYWPNAGVFVHPLALQSQLLYYQGLAAGNSYTLPPERSPVPAVSGTATPAPEAEPQPSPTGSSDSSTPSAAGTRSKRGTGQTVAPGQAPAKRKRSAIFIPPVAGDSSTSPATEVSICKFKFTGGARPSLQEKKMLSVDSGGNFRYYSGTGDKASRGYEFFPRESLQQAGSGGPLTATPAPAPPAPPAGDPARRKRKSRKSLQREKLEQTFKEKGFLIQTQQLESAEGATYCKFRQLRKFTRYLFRSWKDYLPGAINNEAEAAPLAVQQPPQTNTKENSWS